MLHGENNDVIKFVLKSFLVLFCCYFIAVIHDNAVDLYKSLYFVRSRGVGLVFVKIHILFIVTPSFFILMIVPFRVGMILVVGIICFFVYDSAGYYPMRTLLIIICSLVTWGILFVGRWLIDIKFSKKIETK